ncbi:hypothetical protein MXB_1728 [Myxobolus squamalis]|nr:hypothetical protein MXB_1728 [Myxobolus squamalis]
MRFTVLPYLKKKTLEINIQNSACETLSNPSDTIDSALPPSTRTSTETPPIEIIIPDELECNKAIKILLKYLQIFTACSKSFAHGGNDVCNAVAPLMTIWMIYESGSIAVKAEPNILFLAFGALGMSVGIILWGTRVMETIGNRITEITPVGGFSIDFSSSTTVLISTMARIPISTTHCTVGSTVAIGWWRKGFKSVDKKILLSILICWIVSIPIPAVLSITIFLTLRTIVFGFPPM